MDMGGGHTSDGIHGGRKGMWGLPALLLGLAALWVGCPEHGEIDEFTPGDDDTTAPADDDSADPEHPCLDQDWPEHEVEILSECGTELPDAPELDVVFKLPDVDGWPTLHAGRFADANGDGVVDVADPMQVWLKTGMEEDEHRHLLVGHDGTTHASILEGIGSGWATVGELDASCAGMEYIVVYSPADSGTGLVQAYNGTDRLWTTTIPEEDVQRPWFTDLEADGQAEVLVGRNVLDAGTGVEQLTLAGPLGPGVSLSMDLDLDGLEEIIFHPQTGDTVELYAADGSWLSSCWMTPPPLQETHGHSLAIGDLDGDPEGEIVFAYTQNDQNGDKLDHVVLCDSDGTALAQTSVGLGGPYWIGLGQLDGDSLPEIVIGDQHGLVVLDADLSLLWKYSAVPDDGSDQWSPIALADLTGDGFHEIITRVREGLYVVDRLGQELASITDEVDNARSVFSAPAVFDVDADGLAEIVVPSWEVFSIVENPAGGWAAADADQPWPGPNKFPGDRRVDGTAPGPAEVHWSESSSNVWQGVPPVTSPIVPEADLAVEEIDVCTAEGETDAYVTAYVANHGHLWTVEDVVVFLLASDGTFLGDEILSPVLSPGTARPVQFVVSQEDIAAGFVVSVDPTESIAECDETNNTAEGSL